MRFEILADWNPWWTNGIVPPALKGVQRECGRFAMSTLEDREVTILSGVRRSGKTTIMYQLIDRLLTEGVAKENILFLNLEDPTLINTELDDMFSTYRQHFFPRDRIYMFMDEIQGIAGWERWLKKQYDLGMDAKLIVSGSNSSLLTGEYATHLTGRNINIRIFPLSFREYLVFSDEATRLDDIARGGREAIDSILHSFDTYLENGGFPESFSKEKYYRKILLQQYFNDILYRDIVYRHKVNPGKLTSLALYLVSNSGNPMTMRKLRGATGLSFDTLRALVSHLQDAFLIMQVSAFSFSEKAALMERQPKKYYCIDTGLRNAVAHRFSGDFGRSAENAVAVELLRRGERFSYWHEKNAEVDFVYLGDAGKPIGINVCLSDSPPSREIDGLVRFADSMKNGVDGLLLLIRDKKETKETAKGYEIEVMPIYEWLFKEQRCMCGRGRGRCM